jgi:hypothetical protein
MPVLNHHIVAASDADSSSLFLAETLGLEQPVTLGPFAVVKVSDDSTLDFVAGDGPIHSQHYACLAATATRTSIRFTRCLFESYGRSLAASENHPERATSPPGPWRGR